MKTKSRSRKALYNTIAGFTYEFIQLICGLILPRLILSAFGSKYNGLTSSITQFISCISLLKAGIGGVTRAALYKPLAENNVDEISVIVNQTEKFMRKIALFFVGFIIIFAAIYPVLINKEFEWMFSSTLILIISLSTFVQYYFGFTYQLVLMADQRQYVVSIADICSTVFNTIIAVIIIKLGGGIHIVKLGSAFALFLPPIIINIYVRKKYSINRKIEGRKDVISQRWDAVGHSVANFVNTNTDIMVLTIFSGLGNVSVYTIYNYVITAIRKVITNFITGFGAAFGNMYARNEIKLMYENLRIYELIVFSISSIVYSVTFVMITPFAMYYTRGITDANYYQPLFGYILTLAGAFTCFRIPYETIVKALGHYKQTKRASYLEAIINIVISVIAVIKFGLIGVAFGTLVAAIYRSTLYAIYLSKNILKRSVWIYIQRVILTIIIGVGVYLSSKLYMTTVLTLYDWLLMAVITTLIAITFTLIFDLIFYFYDTKRMCVKLRRSFLKKK